METKLWALAKERYKADATEYKRYGGKTVTVFFVGRVGDERAPSKWVIVRGYGATPGQRKTDAICRARKMLADKGLL